MNEDREIAGYEYWKEKLAEEFEDYYGRQIDNLNKQIFILKEHQYAIETMLRHQGIELQEMKEDIAKLKLSI
jgi:hypothetical protein